MITAVVMSTQRLQSQRGSQARTSLSPPNKPTPLCGAANPTSKMIKNTLKNAPRNTPLQTVLKWDIESRKYQYQKSAEIDSILALLKETHPFFWKCSFFYINLLGLISALFLLSLVSGLILTTFLIFPDMEAAYKALFIIILLVGFIFLLNGGLAMREVAMLMFFNKRKTVFESFFRKLHRKVGPDNCLGEWKVGPYGAFLVLRARSKTLDWKEYFSTLKPRKSTNPSYNSITPILVSSSKNTLPCTQIDSLQKGPEHSGLLSDRQFQRR